MRIGVDLDGVIVDSIPRWIEVLNRGSGHQFGPHELPSTHSTPELAAYTDRHEVEMLIVPPPVQGAVQALHRLRELGHTLVVITARSPRLRHLTEAWLAYHGITVDGLHCLEGGSKALVAVNAGIDIMVEDTPHHALALARAGVPVLLFAAPYNLDTVHEGIRLCEGWEQVLAEIEHQRRATQDMGA